MARQIENHIDEHNDSLNDSSLPSHLTYTCIAKWLQKARLTTKGLSANALRTRHLNTLDWKETVMLIEDIFDLAGTTNDHSLRIDLPFLACTILQHCPKKANNHWTEVSQLLTRQTIKHHSTHYCQPIALISGTNISKSWYFLIRLLQAGLQPQRFKQINEAINMMVEIVLNEAPKGMCSSFIEQVFKNIGSYQLPIIQLLAYSLNDKIMSNFIQGYNSEISGVTLVSNIETVLKAYKNILINDSKLRLSVKKATQKNSCGFCQESSKAYSVQIMFGDKFFQTNLCNSCFHFYARPDTEWSIALPIAVHAFWRQQVNVETLRQAKQVWVWLFRCNNFGQYSPHETEVAKPAIQNLQVSIPKMVAQGCLQQIALHHCVFSARIYLDNSLKLLIATANNDSSQVRLNVILALSSFLRDLGSNCVKANSIEIDPNCSDQWRLSLGKLIKLGMNRLSDICPEVRVASCDFLFTISSLSETPWLVPSIHGTASPFFSTDLDWWKHASIIHDNYFSKKARKDIGLWDELLSMLLATQEGLSNLYPQKWHHPKFKTAICWYQYSKQASQAYSLIHQMINNFLKASEDSKQCQILLKIIDVIELNKDNVRLIFNKIKIPQLLKSVLTSNDISQRHAQSLSFLINNQPKADYSPILRVFFDQKVPQDLMTISAGKGQLICSLCLSSTELDYQVVNELANRIKKDSLAAIEGNQIAVLSKCHVQMQPTKSSVMAVIKFIEHLVDSGQDDWVRMIGKAALILESQLRGKDGWRQEVIGEIFNLGWECFALMVGHHEEANNYLDLLGYLCQISQTQLLNTLLVRLINGNYVCKFEQALTRILLQRIFKRHLSSDNISQIFRVFEKLTYNLNQDYLILSFLLLKHGHLGLFQVSDTIFKALLAGGQAMLIGRRMLQFVASQGLTHILQSLLKKALTAAFEQSPVKQFSKQRLYGFMHSFSLLSSDCTSLEQGLTKIGFISGINKCLPDHVNPFCQFLLSLISVINCISYSDGLYLLKRLRPLARTSDLACRLTLRLTSSTPLYTFMTYIEKHARHDPESLFQLQSQALIDLNAMQDILCINITKGDENYESNSCSTTQTLIKTKPKLRARTKRLVKLDDEDDE